jgi:putative selenium metabolism protein SsnA
MARLSLRNATFVSLLPELRVDVGDLVVEGTTVVAFGPNVAAQDSSAIDCRGAVVLPGLVNAHTHLYSALAVGMPAPERTPTNFVEILEQIWWRLDRALDAESLELSALVGGLEAARSGVTVLFDHHASPEHIPGSLDTIAAALETVGLRAVLCYEVTDRNGPSGCEAGLQENQRFANAWQGVDAPLFSGLIGGHASFTLSEGTLSGLAAVCRSTGRGFHVHVAEDGADVKDANPIDRFQAHGLLGPQSVLVHGVHLSPSDLDTVAKAGCWLVHNPRSNMNNAVGYAKLAAGYPKVALGTDGIGCDVLTEMRTAFLKARDEGVENAWEFPIRLMQGGLMMASEHLDRPMGGFTPGSAGDVVLTNYVGATPVTQDNVAGHLLFGLDRSFIEQVFARGRRIWPTALDEYAIAERARGAAKKLWEKMRTFDG